MSVAIGTTSGSFSTHASAVCWWRHRALLERAARDGVLASQEMEAVLREEVATQPARYDIVKRTVWHDRM